MGGKTKTTRQKTKFDPLPLGKPAFFGPQEKLFGRVGDILGQRLGDPLATPEFAAGRDFLSRRTESLKRKVRGAPNIFAGLRRGAERDIEATETRALSDLIGQIRQSVIQDVLSFSTGQVPRGGVGATSGQVSAPGITAGEQFSNIGLSTLGAFGKAFGQGIGGAAAGGVASQFGGTIPQGVFDD